MSWTSGEPWIGVDFDGTLARVEPKQGSKIGAPIPAMVARVRWWLKQGKRVKIFTARAAVDDPVEMKAIREWCVLHLGKELEITNAKDPDAVEIWDDIAVGVIRNTGVRADRQSDLPSAIIRTPRTRR